MIIDCISDLHGHLPKLEGGDLLIIAGDCTSNDKIPAWHSFFDWLEKQQYRKKIIVGGNHDNFCKSWAIAGTFNDDAYDQMYPGEKPLFDYLSDSGTEFEGLKIWGSPWTLTFQGINKHCKAFTGREYDLQDKLKNVPADIDIIITHSPPWGLLDVNREGHHCGSLHIRNCLERIQPKLSIFGHIHENGGQQIILKHNFSYRSDTRCFNVSLMNENYEPVNKPTRIIL